MVDKEFKPWLIEINFNPCLELSCPVLNRIIPSMVENSLRIGLDPILPPSNHYPVSKRFSLSDNFLKNLKY
jgi:tubulin monoglycylase TTLL3/8